jgi:hypothetical protein
LSCNVQADIPDSLTKGAASDMIKELEANRPAETATPGQINLLREAMPHTPLADIQRLSKEAASRMINAYLTKKKQQKAKKDKQKEKDQDPFDKDTKHRRGWDKGGGGGASPAGAAV